MDYSKLIFFCFVLRFRTFLLVFAHILVQSETNFVQVRPQSLYSAVLVNTKPDCWENDDITRYHFTQCLDLLKKSRVLSSFLELEYRLILLFKEVEQLLLL